MVSSRSLVVLAAAYVSVAQGRLSPLFGREAACDKTITLTETCTVTATPTCGPTGVITTTDPIKPTEEPKPTLDCGSEAYLIQYNTLYKLDLASGETQTIRKDVGGDDGPINSLGFNIEENFLYGTQGDNLVRILGDGTVEKVAKLPVSPNIGDFDEQGQYWYSKGGKDWGRVDLSPGSPTYGQVVETGTSSTQGIQPPSDWAYTPASPGYFYGLGVSKNGQPQLVRWSTTTKTWSKVYNATGVKATAFGGVMTTSDGYIYGTDNATGGIFRFSINDPKGLRVATGPASNANDATRCFLKPDEYNS